MKSYHKIVSAGYLLLRRENQVLLLRRCNTGYGDGSYSLVSGHNDPHESLRACVIREAREEAGIMVKPIDLELVHVVSRMGTDAHDRVNFFWECYKWEGEIENKEPDKCDDLAWFDLDRLPDVMVPEVSGALSAIARGEMYSEQNYSTSIIVKT